MTNEEALEALTSKNVVNPYLTLEALEIAIEALKREIPDKWIIGRSDGEITYTHDAEDCYCTQDTAYSFCPCCGKKMKL